MRLILAVFFLLFSATTFAQEVEEGENLVVNYTPELGQTLSYAGEMASYAGSADNLVLQYSMKFLNEITVVGELESGYAINAVGRNVEVQADQPIIGDLLAKVMDLAEDVPVRYEVDASGTPLRVINLAEINSIFKETNAELSVWVVEFTTSLGLDEATSGQVQGIMGAMLQQFSDITPEAANQMFLEEANLFGLVTGSTLPLNGMQTYEAEYVWEVTGAMLAVRGSYEVLSYDADADRATIQWRNDFEPDTVKAALAQFMQNMADQMGGEVGAETAAQVTALQDYDISEIADIRVRPSNGDILELTYSKTVTTQGKVKVDRKHYLLLETDDQG